MQSASYLIRPAVAADASALLNLMRQLAQFEAYADQFVVTETDLLARGLQSEQPQFYAFVAQDVYGVSNGVSNGDLIAYAVVYLVEFTFDLRPTMHLKELYVCAEQRQTGVGNALMQAVIDFAKSRQCGRLKWDVLPENHRAQAFYRRLQGNEVKDWQAWRIDL
ncbi:MAG: GNAT family N-acetyltransferase [Undibacterium sp.]|nr:GNAT family N-acetyltransferase [Undibacterium sp.]